MILVEEVSQARDLAALARPWRSLVEVSRLPGPFCNFDWQFEWWRALGPGRTLRTLVATEAGQVVGLLPAFEERIDGARTLALIGSRGGGGDYLAAPSRDRRVERALVEAAFSLDVDLIELDDLDATGPLRATAQAVAFDRGANAIVLERFPCPRISLSPGFATLLSRSGRKDNLRRRRRWLEAQPGYRIECETSPEAVAPFLARFARLHAARWASEGGSQAFSDERLMSFHRQVARRMADEDALRLWTLHVGSEAVAVAWTFDDRDRAVYYQSGFLPAWGSRSVGLVLFARFVEDACERGLREVDLLRGAEPYKFEWTREGRLTVSVQAPLTWRGRAALELRATRRALRRQVTGALPVALRQSMSRMVRDARMRGAA